MSHIDRYIQNKFKYRQIQKPITIKKSDEVIGSGIQSEPPEPKPEPIPEPKPTIDLKEYYLTTGKKGRRKKSFDGSFQF